MNRTIYILIKNTHKEMLLPLCRLVRGAKFHILERSQTDENGIVVIAIEIQYPRDCHRKIKRRLRNPKFRPLLAMVDKKNFIDKVCSFGDECELCKEVFEKLLENWYNNAA